MRSAMIRNSDNVVVNVIIADPAVDAAPEGHTLIGLPDNSPVTFGFIYNSDGSFTDPNPVEP